MLSQNSAKESATEIILIDHIVIYDWGKVKYLDEIFGLLPVLNLGESVISGKPLSVQAYFFDGGRAGGVSDEGFVPYSTCSRDQYHDSTELGLFHRILFCYHAFFPQIFLTISTLGFFNSLILMNKLRSFTLVEMIIVIVLIGIMLSITLNISGNQTKELRFRIARENFLTNYNAFIIRAITTNDSSLKLIFTNTGSSISVSGNNNSPYFENTSTIRISSFNGSTPATATTPSPFVDHVLSFDTNQGRCILEGDSVVSSESVNFTLQYIPKLDIERCYELNLSTCKLRQCP